MDKFLRFLGGMGIAVVYFVLALLLGAAVTSAAPDLWAVCLIAVVLGWGAIFVVAFRKQQPWVGYGVLALPFIAVLVFTVGCFVAFSGSSAPAPG